MLQLKSGIEASVLSSKSNGNRFLKQNTVLKASIVVNSMILYLFVSLSRSNYKSYCQTLNASLQNQPPFTLREVEDPIHRPTTAAQAVIGKSRLISIEWRGNKIEGKIKETIQQKGRE